MLNPTGKIGDAVDPVFKFVCGVVLVMPSQSEANVAQVRGGGEKVSKWFVWNRPYIPIRKASSEMQRA